MSFFSINNKLRISQVIYSKFLTPLALTLATGISAIGTAAHAVTFNFIPASGTSQQAIDGFIAAGNLWSSVLTDNVTINMNIGYSSLGAGILAQTGSSQAVFSYSDIRTALINDRTSTDDFTAVSNLSSGSTFNMAINYTSNNPNGTGSAIPYLDNNGNSNNSYINITTANAQALGLNLNNAVAGSWVSTAGIDASITFSSNFNFDFNRSDGISAGAYDFIGIAAHEIGHTLGFVSGVDILDQNSPNGTTYYPDSAFSYVTPLDLYRFSQTSIGLGGLRTIDWTANTTNKYFSIDGGATNIANFSTGLIHGDGRQASHWKDNLGIGIMDPTAGYGEMLQISTNDQRAMDVIGWNLASATATPVPFEFSTNLSVLILGILGFFRYKKR